MKSRWKLRWFLLAVLAVLTGVFLYGVATAPSKLKKIEFVIVEKNGSWKANISQYVLSYVHSGQDLTPDFLSVLKEQVEALPWVRSCDVYVEGGTLTIKIWEARPSYVLFFDKKGYLIGEDGFVLEQETRVRGKYPMFFYKGKSSPFTAENGFLRVKKSVKIEMELLKSKLKEIKLNGRNPQVSLLDCGVQLAFKSPPVLVFLGVGGGSGWNYFERLSGNNFLKPGIYDFRFEEMLLIKGRKERCLDRKSLR